MRRIALGSRPPGDRNGRGPVRGCIGDEKTLLRFPEMKADKVSFDLHSACDVAPKLRDQGDRDVVELVQNWNDFSEPCYVAEALIKARRMSHDGHRVLRRDWENVAVNETMPAGSGQ